MKVRIKKLNPDAMMPKRAHATDAGYDLYAVDVKVDSDHNIVYDTGIAFEIPDGYAGFVFPRSSNAKKPLLLSNSVGIIDSCYRGPVMLKYRIDQSSRAFEGMIEKNWNSDTSKTVTYGIGERVGQIVILPVPDIEFEEATELSSTDRGAGGYGSSGK